LLSQRLQSLRQWVSTIRVSGWIKQPAQLRITPLTRVVLTIRSRTMLNVDTIRLFPMIRFAPIIAKLSAGL
jgi:hypothetical protein